MYIYLVTNKHNGKRYLGKTVGSIDKRWKSHINQAKHKKSKNSRQNHFHNAILKYGNEMFELKEIEKVDTEIQLNEREIFWIKVLAPEYNKTHGGEGKSTPKSEETKRRLSEKKKGGKWIYDPTTLLEKYILRTDKIDNYPGWILGRTPAQNPGGKRGEYSKERAAKLIKWRQDNPNPMLGRKHSEETKQKLKNRIVSEESKQKMRDSRKKYFENRKLFLNS